jgi:adenylate cyclase
MAIEIERKFLVKPGAWSPRNAGTRVEQGYLSTNNGRTVRVRIAGDIAKLTVKGPTTGLSRSEFEYTIPVSDARLMLDELCEPPHIDKHRYLELHGRHTWEIDVFHGDNEGLVVAEVELASEEDVFELPEWAGQEVSADFRYSNGNLRRVPFKTWAR